MRKKPYSESSLLVRGISPQIGRLDFLVKGGRAIGGKKYPLLDIFRVYLVQFRKNPRGGLQTWREADLLNDFGAVAGKRDTYHASCWLASFALDNIPDDHSCERFYQALTAAFARMAASAGGNSEIKTDLELINAAAVVGCLFVFLRENGLLPEKLDLPKHSVLPSQLIEMAEAGFNDPPSLEYSQWIELYSFAARILRKSDYIIPKVGKTQE